MKKKTLRSIAEDSFVKKEFLNQQKLEGLSSEEISSIIHDLEVHKIELEMQNEELQRTQKELEKTKIKYFDLYDLAPVGYLVISEKGLIQEVNLTAANMLGLARSDLIKRRLSQYIYNDDQHIYYNHKKELLESLLPREWELRMIRDDGTIFWAHIKATVALEEDKQTFRIILSDFTEKRKRIEEIEYLSYHDFLTGLYNRRFFEEEMNRYDVPRNYPISIVMGDVNGLKLVNDSFGHKTGDLILKKTAEVILKACRIGDIVARVGGDEFIVLLPKAGEDVVKALIKRINNSLENESIEGIPLSVSFGQATKTQEQENLSEMLKEAEDHMYRYKLYENTGARIKTVDLIINTLYAKNYREMLHSQRVSGIAASIATYLGYSEDEISNIKTAGLMHDIGKIAIEDKILKKTEKLNQHESNEIKKHCEIGYRILSSVAEFSEIANIVLEHQESWDGTGYPRGLKGDEISKEARIIAVADSFDAMTGERSYGTAYNIEEAINELNRCSGTQFDPEIVKAFIDSLKIVNKNKK